MDQLDFSDFFSTKEEAGVFSDSLEAICENIYRVDFNIENELTKRFGMHKKDRLLALLREQTFNGLSNKAVKECLQRWQSMVVKIPVLDIVVAFEPTEQTVKVLSDWVSVNLHRQFLFAIAVDKSLIGGATISFNGKHLDFSIRPAFEKILDEKPATSIKPQEAVHQSTEHSHMGN